MQIYFCSHIICLCFIDQNPEHDGHDQARDIIFLLLLSDHILRFRKL